MDNILDKYKFIVDEVIKNVNHDKKWLDDLNMLIFDVAMDHFENTDLKESYEFIQGNWHFAQKIINEYKNFGPTEIASLAVTHTEIGDEIRKQLEVAGLKAIKEFTSNNYHIEIIKDNAKGTFAWKAEYIGKDKVEERNGFHDNYRTEDEATEEAIEFAEINTGFKR